MSSCQKFLFSLCTLLFLFLTNLLQANDEIKSSSEYKLIISPFVQQYNQHHEEENTFELIDMSSVPMQETSPPALGLDVQDHIKVEKTSRYFDTSVMLIQTGLYTGVSLYNALSPHSMSMPLLENVFMYGFIASITNAAARWGNWYYYVKDVQLDEFHTSHKDFLNLRKLTVMTDLSYLLLYLFPIAVFCQEEATPYFATVLALSGFLTLWTCFTLRYLLPGSP